MRSVYIASVSLSCLSYFLALFILFLIPSLCILFSRLLVYLSCLFYFLSLSILFLSFLSILFPRLLVYSISYPCQSCSQSLFIYFLPLCILFLILLVSPIFYLSQSSSFVNPISYPCLSMAILFPILAHHCLLYILSFLPILYPILVYPISNASYQSHFLSFLSILFPILLVHPISSCLN